MTENEQLDILEEWLKHHRGIIFKIVRSYTLADHDDLFQEIIIQLWRCIPTFRREASVTTWMYRIALNTAIKWNKKKHSSSETLDKVQHLLQANSTQIYEQLKWLYGEIYKLDEIDRTLLLLEGFSYKEMSAILGISWHRRHTAWPKPLHPRRSRSYHIPCRLPNAYCSDRPLEFSTHGGANDP